MRSIINVMLLEFTNICFPTKVLTINKGNSFISFIRRFVLCVGIESVLRLSFFFLIFLFNVYCCISLNICSFNWLWDNLILGCNYGYFDGIGFCFHRNCLFHIIMGILLSIEAYYFMFVHSVSLFWNSWDCLNESNHCFVTLRIKLSIITSFDWFKRGCTILNWILGDIRLDRVLKICKESNTIF